MIFYAKMPLGDLLLLLLIHLLFQNVHSSFSANIGNASSSIVKRSIRINPDGLIQHDRDPVLENNPFTPTPGQWQNRRIFFFEIKEEPIRQRGGGQIDLRTRYISKAFTNTFAYLAMSSCIEAKPKDSFFDEFPHSPFVHFRVKTGDFFEYKQEADRCATTYLYKMGEPGREMDQEERNRQLGNNVLENGETRVRNVWFGENVDQLMPHTQSNMSGKIMHELFHAFGFIHEHQRPDRDNYVSVPSEGIDQVGQCASTSQQCFMGEFYEDREHSRFKIVPGPEVDTFAQPFDYGSIMNFNPLPMREYAPEREKKRMEGNLLNDMPYEKLDIITHNTLFQSTIGQRNGESTPNYNGRMLGPSFQDLKRLNLKYCDLWKECTKEDHLRCRNGGFPNPSVYKGFNWRGPVEGYQGPLDVEKTSPNKEICKSCICPDGYGGQNCEELKGNTQRGDFPGFRWNPKGSSELGPNDLEYFYNNCPTAGLVRVAKKGGGFESEHPTNRILRVNTQSRPRGFILVPILNSIDYHDREDRTVPISCYWLIKPTFAYEKVGIKLIQVNLPCLFPCHSYVEIKYKRDKSLTGARFCCPIGAPGTLIKEARGGRKRKASEAFDAQEKPNNSESTETKPNEYPEIIADNGVPVLVIFRMHKASDLFDKGKYANFYNPGFHLQFWAINASKELYYDLSYQVNKYHLPRDSRGRLAVNDPFREGAGYGADWARSFAPGGLLPEWAKYSDFNDDPDAIFWWDPQE